MKRGGSTSPYRLWCSKHGVDFIIMSTVVWIDFTIVCAPFPIVSAVHGFSLWYCRWQNSVTRRRRDRKWRRCPLVSGHPGTPMSPLMECCTVGGSPTRRGQYCPLHGSMLTAVHVGRPTTRASSTLFVGIRSMRGASSPYTVRTAWRRALSVLLEPHTMRGKVSFFYLLSVSCKCW